MDLIAWRERFFAGSKLKQLLNSLDRIKSRTHGNHLIGELSPTQLNSDF